MVLTAQSTMTIISGHWRSRIDGIFFFFFFFKGGGGGGEEEQYKKNAVTAVRRIYDHPNKQFKPQIKTTV